MKLSPPTEYQDQVALCKWMNAQYPHVLYRSDLGGTRLPIGLAKKMKAIQKSRAFPDFQILKAVGRYHGLFIELKREGEKIQKKNGTWASPHIQEQASLMHKLNNNEGYFARFAIGFNEAKNIITDYLENRL